MLAIAATPLAPTATVGVVAQDARFGHSQDRFTVGPSDDTIRGNRRENHICGRGDDGLFGRRGPADIFGGRGKDFLNGNIGDGTLLGGDGNDRLNDHTGGSHAESGPDDDVIYRYDGHAGTDSVSCGDGQDYVEIDEGDVVSDDCEIVNYDWEWPD